MLRKFRRNSKEPIGNSSARWQEDTAQTGSPSADVQQSTRLTFFDLPAEIRNSIYEFVISDTTLSLSSNLFAPSKKSRISLKKRKSLSLPTPINGLLLASRQCRREYLSFLFSIVSVVIEVQDFDFENLIRVSSSLDDLQIQSLQTNRHLTVLLKTRNCSSKDLASLKRWLDYQKDRDINLPWKYEFPLDKLLPPTTMGRVRLLRELEYYADMIAMLDVDLNEAQKLDLQSIIDAFVSQAKKLDEDLSYLGQRSRSLTQSLRGLPGGGVH